VEAASQFHSPLDARETHRPVKWTFANGAGVILALALLSLAWGAEADPSQPESSAAEDALNPVVLNTHWDIAYADFYTYAGSPVRVTGVVFAEHRIAAMWIFDVRIPSIEAQSYTLVSCESAVRPASVAQFVHVEGTLDGRFEGGPGGTFSIENPIEPAERALVVRASNIVTINLDGTFSPPATCR